MKKLHMQERAIEEVKLAIKPFYQKRDITKEEYKEILRKAVQKVIAWRWMFYFVVVFPYPLPCTACYDRSKHLWRVHLHMQMLFCLCELWNHYVVMWKWAHSYHLCLIRKVRHSKSGEINPVKVANLVKAYVDKYKHARKHKKEETGQIQHADVPKDSQTLMWGRGKRLYAFQTVSSIYISVDLDVFFFYLCISIMTWNLLRAQHLVISYQMNLFECLYVFFWM